MAFCNDCRKQKSEGKYYPAPRSFDMGQMQFFRCADCEKKFEAA